MAESSLGSVPQDEPLGGLRARVLLLILPGSVLLGQILILVAEALHWPLKASVLGLILTLFPLAAGLFLSRWYRASLWLLVLGYLAITYLSLHWVRSDAVLSMFAVPAGLATLLIGAGQGLGISVVVSFLLLTDAILPGGAENLSRLPALATIWAIQALIWTASRFASEAVEWSSSNYERMRGLLEAARDQQVRLKRTRADLVQANLELARLSERLSAMRQMAEEARRAKEEFVANVSHELRTPLNMIIGFSEMITQAPQVYGSELPPKLLADIDVVQRNSQHLANLVNDVLDLSQVDAGRMALSKEWGSLREIVESAVKAVVPLFESKGLYLEQDSSEDLPPLFCDRTRIRQVILNLLSNAGRFTDRGGARVRLTREGHNLIVSVSDTGSGILPEDQQRIFEPFEQLTGTVPRRYGGSGLGLAISQRFVDMHGGRMWLESEVGTGTTFHFSLPLDEWAGPSLGGVARWFSPYHQYDPRARSAGAPPPRLTPRFVVVEPRDALQRLLGRYQDDSEVVVVRDLNEAVRELTRLPAQALIINDPTLQHPPSQLARVKALPYATPVIACWLPDEEEAAKRLGVVRYLVKPVSREMLLSALDNLGRPVDTVLLVDDQPEALQLFGRMLASAGRGYRVLRALNGQRALALLRERKPDVLLLDLIMPGMDGYTVLREKSQDPQLRDIPVVAISAKDPAQGPVASSFLTVARSGSLSSRDLLNCIQAISQVLAPPDRVDGQGRSGTSAD